MIHEKTFTERLSMLIGRCGNLDFEQKTGISEVNICKYLEGESLPTLQILEKIAVANRVSIGWLIGEEEHPNRNVARESSFPDKSMLEMAEWIREQNDGINYWEVIKAKFAKEYPEFKDWLIDYYSEKNADDDK